MVEAAELVQDLSYPTCWVLVSRRRDEHEFFLIKKWGKFYPDRRKKVKKHEREGSGMGLKEKNATITHIGTRARTPWSEEAECWCFRYLSPSRDEVESQSDSDIFEEYRVLCFKRPFVP